MYIVKNTGTMVIGVSPDLEMSRIDTPIMTLEKQLDIAEADARLTALSGASACFASPSAAHDTNHADSLQQSPARVTSSQ